MNFFEKLSRETESDRVQLMDAPIIARCLRKEITIDDYVGFLAQAYHHVKHTTPLLMAVGARIPEDKEWLRNAIAEYIEEELGHQEWILNDIASCGYDKDFVTTMQPHASTELMVAYAYDTINRGNPLRFFGMVHVLEGTSVNVAEKIADAVRETLGLSEQAFTYLYSHGSLDQQHVKFFADLMNQITDESEQELIIHSCKMFYQLYGNIFNSLSPAHGIPLTPQRAQA